MSWLMFLIVGLVAGILAKAIMPGTSKEPSGWILTILLGVVGAYVGGWLGGMLFGAGPSNLLTQILFATGGAIVIIAVMRLLTGSRRAV